MYVFIKLLIKYKYGSSYYSEKFKDHLGHCRLDVRENELLYITPKSKATIDVSRYLKLESSKFHYYLYTTPNSAITVPKRIFNSLDQETEFKNFLERISKS